MNADMFLFMAFTFLKFAKADFNHLKLSYQEMTKMHENSTVGTSSSENLISQRSVLRALVNYLGTNVLDQLQAYGCW